MPVFILVGKVVLLICIKSALIMLLPARTINKTSLNRALLKHSLGALCLLPGGGYTRAALENFWNQLRIKQVFETIAIFRSLSSFTRRLLGVSKKDVKLIKRNFKMLNFNCVSN